MTGISKKGLITPNKLQRGDKLAAITLAFGAASLFPDRLRVGCEQMKKAFGVEVVPTPHALADPTWLAANPQARADDLMMALEDPTVAGIVSIIGGEDSLAVNGRVPLEVIRDNPKVFLGYSDSTTTHLYFLKAGVVSFYGPSVMTQFAENCGISPYTAKAVERTLFRSERAGLVEHNLDGWSCEFLDWAVPENQSRPRNKLPGHGPQLMQGEGVVRGPLIGGCVEALDMTRGTFYWPRLDQFEGAILFLEIATSDYRPHLFACSLRTYGVMGILDRVSAIVTGRPGGEKPEEHQAYNDVLRRVVSEEFGRGDLPLLVDMSFGHTNPVFVLPYGIMTELDCSSKTLRILEPGVAGG